jgi:Flp pilus assembly protein TadG
MALGLVATRSYRRIRLNMQNKKTPQIIYNSLGQISIFFSTTVLVMITFIAFIINIGIFVKAKINLQNATDAAAYAGASVQARQLTNIAYMNWEMRNVYKEWMFKYYVLGGLNLEGVLTPDPIHMDFTMEPYTRTESDAIDNYNFPSICVDFGSTGAVGMCTKYLVPGLPRFSQANILGMDETTNAFVDTIVSEKSLACSVRSRINFLTANTWAYNVKTGDDTMKNITDQAPQIASNFMGAFPKAFEVGLRIRNLEAEVNFPPQTGVCINPSTGVDCNVSMRSLTNPSQERTMKAFQSAWRNLGKNGSDKPLMKNSFTLTEIPPKLDTSTTAPIVSLSGLLIPDGHPARDKYYVDLKLMTVNYATFYTAFATTKSSAGDSRLEVGGSTVDSEGQCNATKVGLPVPGYPLGFVKNPDYLTYYAVQGKAKFVGLFNPFGKEITLSAYAAAKPFGGRIGPMTFDVSHLSQVTSRSTRISSAFITALDTATFRGTFGADPGVGKYAPGMPVPINVGTGNGKFWLEDSSDSVGGWLEGENIFYGIPNMIYDYPSGIGNRSGYLSGSSQEVQVIPPGGGESPSAGLYNSDMFNKFRSKLRGITQVGANIFSPSSEDIHDAIIAIRSPTLFEAHNYLIPTPEDLNKSLKVDSWGVITGVPDRVIQDDEKKYSIYNFEVYAPLTSPSSIYTSHEDLTEILVEYLERQKPAVNKYRNSMAMVAADIFTANASGATGQNTGAQAALALSDLNPPGTAYNDISANPTNAQNYLPTCKSIAGQFLNFYTGDSGSVDSSRPNFDPDDCVPSLTELLSARWQNSQLTGQKYLIEYALPEDLTDQLYTAYRPGRDHDAGLTDGIQTNVINNKKFKMIRNFYSTKFIPLKSVSRSGEAAYREDAMLIYSEGTSKNISSDARRGSFKNPLNGESAGLNILETTH